jgi:N-acetylglucosamine-6-sulfatase
LSISYRVFILFYVSFVVSLFSGCAGENGVAQLPVPERENMSLERPNIILVLTDDLDVESVSRLESIKTLMSEQGVTFENSFVTDPLCCPSRATTLRGQYSHNHGVRTNIASEGGYPRFRDLGRERSTVATWLKGGGYETAMIGKYFNGYKTTSVPPGWDEWHAGLTPLGYTDFEINENGHIVSYSGEDDYLTDVMAQKAESYIRRAGGGEKPFFLYFSPKAPHDPAMPALRHRDLFPDVERAPRPPSFNEKNVKDKPHWVRKLEPLGEEGISYIDRLYRKRLRSMVSVGEALERMIYTLQETGELENTYIFFTSDNGWHMGQHRLIPGKWAPYEEDIRVPLIVRGPGVPAGESRAHMALNNDLALTFAALAGVTPPPFVDGRSLVPLIGAAPPPPSEWRSAFLVEAAKNPKRDRPPFRAVRTGRYLYVQYRSGEQELYDLREDPYQLRSIHASARPALLKKLRTRLDALKGCSARECRVAED